MPASVALRSETESREGSQKKTYNKYKKRTEKTTSKCNRCISMDYFMERREGTCVTQTRADAWHGNRYPIDKGCLKRRPRAETVESSLRIMKCSRSTMRSTLLGHCFP